MLRIRGSELIANENCCALNAEHQCNHTRVLAVAKSMCTNNFSVNLSVIIISKYSSRPTTICIRNCMFFRAI